MKLARSSLTIALFLVAAACKDNSTQSESHTQQNDFPLLTGRVADQADLLSPDQEIDLSSKSQALEAMTGRQFVIVTVNSLRGENAETYTRDLGRAWKIGNKDRNDGVILLTAPNEHQIRIAVGDGLRQTFPDASAQDIVDKTMLPKFRKGDLSAGIVAGADAVVAKLSPSGNSRHPAQ